MSQNKPIEPLEDWDLDDPDTAIVEALNSSPKPEHVLRARELVLRKVHAAAKRAAGVASRPPSCDRKKGA